MALNKQYIYDANLVIKDAGLIAASAACQVDSSDQILDLGEGFIEGDMIVDATVVDIDSSDELYTIILEGSGESDFASDIVPLAVLLLGANEAIVGGCDVDSTAGRYPVPFRNERDGIIYPYVRGYIVVAGSVTAEGINCAIWLSKSIGG